MTRRRLRPGQLIWGNLINASALVFICLPLVALLLGAIQTEQSLLGVKQHLLPSQLTAENFAVLLGLGSVSDPLQAQNVSAKGAQFPRAFLNSIVVSTLTTTATLV